MTTAAEAEIELASAAKRPREEEDEAAAAAPVEAAPAAKAARLEEESNNASRAPEEAEPARIPNANDAPIRDADDAPADDAPADDARPHPHPHPPAPPPSTSAALLGLPQRWDANHLRAWLRDDLQCDFTTCRKKRGGPLAFVTFPSVDARRAADAAVRKAKKIPGGGRLVLRDERGGNKQQEKKKGQQNQARKMAHEIDVRDVVTPLWRLPYKGQLRAKARRLRGVLQRIEAGIGIGTGTGTGGSGGGSSSKAPPATAIDFCGILRSPTTDGYRNKCEFTVGLGVGENEGREDGGAECGFCLGAYRDGIVEVGSPRSCRNVSGVAKACAEAFASFMREGSKLPPWDKRHNSGFWRLLIVREGRRETVLPRPPPPQGGGGAAVCFRSSPPPPPPPFASLDWRPWLVGPPDLEEGAREKTGEEEEEAEKAEAEGGAAAAAAPPPPSPAPAPFFEPPPADEILLVVQVDPTAPGARGNEALVRSELAALGRALRGAVSSYCGSFDPPPSSSPSPSPSPERSPARLVLQHHSGISNSAPDDAPLLPWPPGEEEEEGGEGEERQGGEEKESEKGFITDALCGLRFRVSPSAFFQVNSGAAALLYRLALDWAGLEKKKGKDAEVEAEAEEEEEKKESSGGGGGGGEPETESSSFVFLDVCCGTGTIGICAAAAGAKRVVGVDVVEAAVRDAEANARANGLSLAPSSSSSSTPNAPSSASSPSAPSCRFVAAKAEDVMSSLLKEEEQEGSGKKSRFVAVVDPPRAGLHAKVRNALRGCPAVSRVVYVSCNPDTLASDCIHLCTRGGHGRAFRPVRAAAADLFPMTSHCEAVLLLER